MNSKKILAAAVSVAAIASLTACGGVKDDTTAGADSGNAITIGTTDKITSLDPAGSYDNGSYAVQIQVFPFLYAQDYNTSELSPDIAADDGTWNDDGTEFTVKLKDGLKFANGNDLTASDVKFSYDRIKKINDPNGPSSLLANVESVTAKDDTTVVFKDSVPFDVTLKQVMSSPAGPRSPPGARESSVRVSPGSTSMRVPTGTSRRSAAESCAAACQSSSIPVGSSGALAAGAIRAATR